MKYVVRAEWISYDRTNIHDGTIATEFDPLAQAADQTTDIFLVDASNSDEAVAIVRRWRPWEVQPTQVYAAPALHPSPGEVQHISTERAPYWRYNKQLSSKERIEEIRSVAIDIVQSSGVDVTVQVQILPLAKQLAKRTGCTLKTAKIRIAEAVRRICHPDWTQPERGGKREGAGRPTNQ